MPHLRDYMTVFLFLLAHSASILIYPKRVFLQNQKQEKMND